MVDDARVVQTNEMLSHIDHELVKRKGASFNICFLPFFCNLILGFLCLVQGSTEIFYYGRYENWFSWLCLYLGISLCTNLFPQVEDVMMLKENFFGKDKKTISKVLVAPFYALFLVGAYLEKFGLSIVTSIAFSFAVPHILGWFVPALYDLIR